GGFRIGLGRLGDLLSDFFFALGRSRNLHLQLVELGEELVERRIAALVLAALSDRGRARAAENAAAGLQDRERDCARWYEACRQCGDSERRSFLQIPQGHFKPAPQSS